jgi:hypothetical protein
MTTFNWSVSQMDRLTSDGFVITVHYTVSAVEDTYSANTYGTIGYTQEPGETYTPYVDLMQAQVVGWVQTSLGQSNVEASLQGQIDLQKNPVQATGLPWVA